MHAYAYRIPFSRVGLNQFCTGESSVCEAVTSSNLTLICSSCSSANTIIWQRARGSSSSQSLPYNTYIAQIPATEVQPDASGCYTCVCDGNSYSFAVDIRAAGRYTYGILKLAMEMYKNHFACHLYIPFMYIILYVTCKYCAINMQCYYIFQLSWIILYTVSNTGIYSFPSYNVYEKKFSNLIYVCFSDPFCYCSLFGSVHLLLMVRSDTHIATCTHA